MQDAGGSFVPVESAVRRSGVPERSVKWFRHTCPPGKEIQGRREREHHWIARPGCPPPGGYRRPIGLVGGSRLLACDPRTVCFSTGHSGCNEPTWRSADNGETQPLGPWVPCTALRGPCGVEVE
jgi:hypothetical protein